VRGELGGIDGLFEDDRGDDVLAVDRVGDAEHGAVEHRGVAEQHAFDLGGRDLEAAHLDHLLGAVGEVHPAVRLDVADVAGAVPAVVERRRRGFGGQVTGHQRRRAHLDLAGLPRVEGLTRLQRHTRRLTPGTGFPAVSRRAFLIGLQAMTGSSLAP